MIASLLPAPAYRIPDMDCQFSLSYHKNGDAIAADSHKWFADSQRGFTEAKRRRLYAMKAGQLTGYCYHKADDFRLRVVSDFMNFLFHLDDLSDGLLTKETEALRTVVMNAFEHPHSYRRILADGRELSEEEPEASKVARDFWGRCVQGAGPGVRERYCKNMDLFFQAVSCEAKSRDNGVLPDMETYMVLRRDNSGCKPCFDLLEYSIDIDLPDYVLENPTLQVMADCVNDFIALSNDIFSYNVEQSRGDTYNSISIIMQSCNLDLQGAIDRVGVMCKAALDTYQEHKAKLPSWGPEMDKDVAGYVQGLEDWVSGSLYWSFISDRYFGIHHEEVKKNRVVELLPSRLVRSNAA